MNNGETDDTEIVSGDEGDLTPIEDISETSGDLGAEHIVDGVANEGQIIPPQPPEANVEWQPQVTHEAPIVMETVSETVEPGKVKEQPSSWQRIRGLFGGGDVGARLNSLTQAIEDAPESAVNYVLRAELYMTVREYALAQADFQQSIDLAETQFELDDWGLVDQAIRDRAIAGLEKVQRRLR